MLNIAAAAFSWLFSPLVIAAPLTLLGLLTCSEMTRVSLERMIEADV